jgi:hypothetical protein
MAALKVAGCIRFSLRFITTALPELQFSRVAFRIYVGLFQYLARSIARMCRD